MVCLDSSFVIDLWRSKKEAIEIKDKLKLNGEDFLIPSPVVMELVTGAQLSERIDSEKQKICLLLSESRVLNFDRESAFLAGEIQAKHEKKKEYIDLEDIMIAAIALQHHETVVTRNVKHFEKIQGLKIEGY